MRRLAITAIALALVLAALTFGEARATTLYSNSFNSSGIFVSTSSISATFAAGAGAGLISSEIGT